MIMGYFANILTIYSHKNYLKTLKNMLSMHLKITSKLEIVLNLLHGTFISEDAVTNE